MKRVNGTALTPEDRRHVLSVYLYRYTAEHVPFWARKPMPNGEPYPVQFVSDEDWLEHTEFAVRNDGRLDRRVRTCASSPTWPNNPELRRKP